MLSFPSLLQDSCSGVESLLAWRKINLYLHQSLYFQTLDSRRLNSSQIVRRKIALLVIELMTQRFVDQAMQLHMLTSSQIIKSIDFDLPLRGTVQPYEVQLCCLTGRSDWKHSIEEERNSIAARLSQALDSLQNELKSKSRIVISNISLHPTSRTKDNTGSE